MSKVEYTWITLTNIIPKKYLENINKGLTINSNLTNLGETTGENIGQ